MRYQGRITEWKADRGFGFITPNSDTGAMVFLHISAFKPGQRRPAGNEIVTYELVNDGPKGPRAHAVAFVEARRSSRTGRKLGKPGAWKSSIAALMLIALVSFAWQRFSAGQTTHAGASTAPASTIGQLLQAESKPAFRCEGKRYCKQMRSCEEAMFYLNNCPDTEIDGDRDGIPCERQWC